MLRFLALILAFLLAFLDGGRAATVRMNNGRIQLGFETQGQEYGHALHRLIPSMEGVKVTYGDAGEDGVSKDLDGLDGDAAEPRRISGYGAAESEFGLTEGRGAADEGGEEWLFV
ncbi:MAG: hypothetical protein M1831_002100 [Alyxoria varia]|nr:MAG: hypothetical protein M1831_002100 [Alyxoria varia]